jgi:DNA-binding HxlR family transcriptional regulator
MSTPDLIELFHHRSAAPVLAVLARRGGVRFVELQRKLEVGSESLRRALDALVEQGLVARNPGYGHPLRPEYVLTRSGRPVAERCDRLLRALADRTDMGLKKWSMPVLASLEGPMHFSELRAALPGLTPRGLTIALKDLQAAGYVERQVVDAYPPTTVYRVTPAGRALRRVLTPETRPRRGSRGR